jgi:hypothetical protein
VKPTVLFAALVCLSGCTTATHHSDGTVVTLSNLRDTVRIPTVPGWKLYGPLPTTFVHGVSFTPITDPDADFAHRLPTSSIAFRLLPDGTTEADVFAQDSIPLRTTTILVGGAPRTLDCRRNDIVDECFVIVPLHDSVFVAALTVGRPNSKYFPGLERQFCDALAQLKLP